MGIKTAFCYCRVSSGRQRTEKGGFGMSRQQALLTAYVEEYEDRDCLGYDLSVDNMVFLKAEGVSGFSGKNIEKGSVLHSFITDYKSGKIKNAVLIIENIDRFSRANPNEAAELFLGLINKGCDVHEIDTETVHHRCSDLNQISSGLTRSHKESLRKQKLSIKNWDERFEKTVKKHVPLTGRCPGWLKVENNRYKEIPERVAPIRLIFEWYNNGYGQAYIRDRLNSEGYKYNGKTWSNWSVHRVLKDERVTGKHRTQSTLRNNFDGIMMYPTVVTELEFKRAEQRLTKPGRDKKINRRANTLFSGVLICGLCKVGHILINNENGKRFGRCSHAIAGNKRCVANGFKYNVVENTLLKFLRHLDFGGLSNSSHAAEVENLSSELIHYSNYLANVQRTVDSVDIPSETDYKVLKNLEAKVRDLQGKIDALKALENVSVSYEDIVKKINYELLDVSNIEVRQDFNIKIRKIIREIKILKIQKNIVLVSVSFYVSNDVQWLTISLKEGLLLSNTYVENKTLVVTLGNDVMTYNIETEKYYLNSKEISNEVAYALFG
ncbi:TPA: recombinase family protein [Enterobacter roggenkampii]|nr:recombinase family protein [Enterobacter roggenkampii]